MRMCRLCLFDRNDDTAKRCRQCGGDMASDDDDDDDDVDSAWFHYVTIPNVGTIELVPGRVFNFGKSPRSELVLPKASADQIASLFWTDDYAEATLKECGATEVVKVEGVRIKGTRTLKGGEELEVGPLRMKYLKRASPVEGAIDARKTAPRGGPGGAGPDPSRGVATPGKSMRGALEPPTRRPFDDGPPAKTATGSTARPGGGPAQKRTVGATPGDVALVLEQKKVTGTLRMKNETGRGWLTFVAGAPRNAAWGDLTGRAALEAILRLTRARLQVIQATPTSTLGDRINVSIAAALASVRAAKPAAPPGPRGTGPRPTGTAPRPGTGTGSRPTGGAPRPGAPPPRRPPGR